MEEVIKTNRCCEFIFIIVEINFWGKFLEEI